MTESMPHCPYCGEQALFVDSKEVHRESHGYIYLCRPCQAWVGCHKEGHLEGMALGTLANAECRVWRHKAHGVFDPLWAAKMFQADITKKRARTAAYKWLATQLGIDYRKCHIANFQKDDCERVVEICSKLYKKGDQHG